MQNLINENYLELACMAYFRQIGYQTVFGPDILPEGVNPLRGDVRQVILPQNVKNALVRLNTGVPQAVLDEAYQLLANPSEATLIARNETIYHYLTDGIKICHKTATGEDTATDVKIVDFNNPENNEFLAVNQFAVQGSVNLRRPDIVVFLNGLPIAVVELKNPSNEKDRKAHV